MDSFVKAALGGKAPEEQSLGAFREAIATMEPDEWPDWVRELAELVNEKCCIAIKAPKPINPNESSIDAG